MSKQVKMLSQRVSRLKRIHTLFLIILCFSFFSACGPAVRDHTINSATSFGAGWYHEGKSPEEMLHDYDVCQSLARQKDDDPFVKNDCMKQKGYILK
jgi:hypothetical protein